MGIRLDTPADSKTIDWLGTTIRLPIRSADTDGRLSAQLSSLAAGSGNPPHVHTREVECFYVIDGEVEVSFGAESVMLATGDLVYLPAGLPHQLRVVSETPAKVLTLLAGGALERAFVEASGADPATIKKVFADYGVEIMDAYDGSYRPPGFEAVTEVDVVVCRSREGAAYWLAGDTYTVLLPGDQTEEQLAVVHFDIPPGGGPVPHVHTRDFEAFVVLTGEVELYADGAITTGHPDDVAVLPENIPHCFKNRTASPAEMLAIVTPAGFDRFIAEAGKPALPGQPAPPVDAAEKARLIATSPKYGVELRPDIDF
ncbi:MAG: cupin domain-containing protein [Planctomycetota bacterium]